MFIFTTCFLAGIFAGLMESKTIRNIIMVISLLFSCLVLPFFAMILGSIFSMGDMDGMAFIAASPILAVITMVIVLVIIYLLVIQLGYIVGIKVIAKIKQSNTSPPAT